MKSQLFISTVVIFSIACLTSCSNTPDGAITTEVSNAKVVKTASEFFDIPKTQVLTVGTFHFDYPGLDALKTEEKDKVDVLSESRQKEMKELIQYLKNLNQLKLELKRATIVFQKI